MPDNAYKAITHARRPASSLLLYLTVNEVVRFKGQGWNASTANGAKTVLIIRIGCQGNFG